MVHPSMTVKVLYAYALYAFQKVGKQALPQVQRKRDLRLREKFDLCTIHSTVLRFSQQSSSPSHPILR